MRYSIEPGDSIFVNNYGFLSFAKNMAENTGDLIGNKIADKITKTASRSIPQTISSKIEDIDTPAPVGKSIVSPDKRHFN